MEREKEQPKMMYYRDMTFCTFYEDCKQSKKCGRPLTEMVKRDAEQWMKDAPIAMFIDKPVCWIHSAHKKQSLLEGKRAMELRDKVFVMYKRRGK